jgi:ketosteroid isomerase-like protein
MIALQNTNSLAMGFQYDAQGDWQTRLDSLIANAPTVWVSDAPALLAIVRREQLAITLATRYPQAIIVYNMPVLTITAYGDSDLSATLANCPLYQK